MKTLKWVAYALICLFAASFLMMFVMEPALVYNEEDPAVPVVGVILSLAVWIALLLYRPSLLWVGYALLWLLAICGGVFPLVAVLGQEIENGHMTDYDYGAWQMMGYDTAVLVVTLWLITALGILVWAIIIWRRMPLRWSLLGLLWFLALPVVPLIGIVKLVIELVGRSNVLAGSRMSGKGISAPPRGLVE